MCLSSGDEAVAPTTENPAEAKDMSMKAYDMVYDLTCETGTMRYMAPEVALGKRYGLKADCFSFATVAWEILILSKPFVGMNSEEFKFRVCYQGIRPNIPSTWHSELTRILKRSWQTDPKMRVTFQEITAALQHVISSSEVPGQPDPLGQDAKVVTTCC